jgi:hypothetical protein
MATCTSLINDIFFNAAQAGGGSVIGECSITTNQRNGVVSYAAGPIAYSRRTSTTPPRWRSVAGVWRQSFPSVHLPYYFSDRRGAQGEPFAQSKIDNLQLEIALVGNDDQLRITLTPLTWTNSKFPVQVVGCDAGVVYGVGGGIGASIPNALYAIWVGRVRQGGFL